MTASDYVSGTITLTNGQAEFTGSGTGWQLADFQEGDTIIDLPGTAYQGVVASIEANGAGTLTRPWDGPSLIDVPYRMRYQGDGSRVTAQARALIELLGNGNLQAFAGLSGSANRIPVFTGPGTMTTVPKTDLVSGAAYDVQVADLAARAAYDPQAEGFAVLVADTGGGRAAIYSKMSNSSGDWSDPAYVTGPIGATPAITVGDTTTGAPGTDADVTATPAPGGVVLDFTIPRGEGFSSEGDYSGATSYEKGDVVQREGSSWIATQPTTGNAPPTLPTTSNTWWQLLARRGTDGAGTMVGVAAGTGINIDNTDPTEPIISAVIASVPEARAGVINDKLMTPLLTAEAIDELAQGYDQNIALLALEVADLKGGRMGMVGGIADPFDTPDGVDAVQSVNEVYNSGAGTYSPATTAPTWEVSASFSPETTANLGSRQIRQRIPASQLVESGDAVRLTFATPASGSSTVIEHCYIGTAATNADFTGDQVRVTFSSGSNGVTLPTSGASVLSDLVMFNLNDAVDLMVAVQFNSESPNSRASASAASGITRYTKAGSGEYADTSVSGYTPTDERLWIPLAQVEARTDPGTPEDMTLFSVAYSAASQPETARAALQVIEHEPVTVNDDFTIEVSRDGGTSWGAANLSLSAVNGTAKLYEDPLIDISGQGAGTSMLWRAKTLNNVNVSFSGVVMQWR